MRLHPAREQGMSPEKVEAMNREQQQLAESAARMDAIIAKVCCVGLLVLIVYQLWEKFA